MILLKILNFLKIYAYSKRVAKLQAQKIHKIKKQLKLKVQLQNNEKTNTNFEFPMENEGKVGNIKYFSRIRRNESHKKLFLNEDSLKL
jgi:hypothetical protein